LDAAGEEGEIAECGLRGEEGIFLVPRVGPDEPSLFVLTGLRGFISSRFDLFSGSLQSFNRFSGCARSRTMSVDAVTAIYSVSTEGTYNDIKEE